LVGLKKGVTLELDLDDHRAATWEAAVRGMSLRQFLMRRLTPFLRRLPRRPRPESDDDGPERTDS
jgi:hypothetical protein